MLKLLRKKGVSKKILWFVAIIIVISFGFFGTASYLSNSGASDYAGKIFGRKISVDQYQKSYLHVRNQGLMRYGENFNKIRPYLHLEAEAWDRLILLHEAKKQHLTASDQEVVAAIAELAMFQRNGRFDPLLYNDILRYVFRCPTREFEEGIRGTVIINKLFETKAGDITLSADELWQGYERQNEKVQVSYVLFDADEYKNQMTVSDAEAQEYYNRHPSDFVSGPSINVQFVKIEAPDTASPEQKAAADQQVEQLTTDLQSTADLAAVAASRKLTVEETGFFSLEQPDLKIGWPFEVLQQAFQLPLNTVSSVETQQGHYFLKIKERRDTRIQDYAEAAEKIKELLLVQQTKQIARTKANEAVEKIRAELSANPDGNFNDIVRAMNLNLQKTEPFSRGEYLSSIGLSREFQEAAFSPDLRQAHRVSEPVETPKGYSIIHVDGFTAASVEQFEKEKDKLAQTLAEEKRSAVFNEFMSSLRQQARLEDRISERMKNS